MEQLFYEVWVQEGTEEIAITQPTNDGQAAQTVKLTWAQLKSFIEYLSIIEKKQNS